MPSDLIPFDQLDALHLRHYDIWTHLNRELPKRIVHLISLLGSLLEMCHSAE